MCIRDSFILAWEPKKDALSKDLHLTADALGATDLIAGVHQGQLQLRIVVRIGVDCDRRRLVVLGPGGHDVWHKCLRVAVVEREPGALNLNRHRVACFEDMIYVVK